MKTTPNLASQQNPAEPLLRRALGSLSLLAKMSGISEEAFVAAVRDSFTAISSSTPEHLPDPALASEIELLYVTLSTWYSHPDYVDATGQPKPLLVSGPATSFESLFDFAKTSLGLESMSFDHHDAIARLEQSSSLENADGLLLAKEQSYRMMSDQATSFTGLLSYAADFLSTLKENATRANQHERGVFQRVAQTPDFPVSQVPMVVSMLHEQGMQLLLDVDSFIEDKRQSHTNGPFVDIGVGLYLYTNETDET